MEGVDLLLSDFLLLKVEPVSFRRTLCQATEEGWLQRKSNR